jgi:hypothetical protein
MARDYAAAYGRLLRSARAGKRDDEIAAGNAAREPVLQDTAVLNSAL